MKYLIILLLSLLSIISFSQQDEYYRTVDWKFYPSSVIQLTDSTYEIQAIPYDYNDPGAINRIVGNYVVDYVGHRYEVIDSTETTITVRDIHHTGQAPQSLQIARCYRSVGNGEADYIGSTEYFPLDESARWKLNGSDNELLWRHGIEYESPFKRLVLDTTYVVTGNEPKGTAYWDNTNRTISIVLNSGTILQLGQEMPVPAYNLTGQPIPNGTAVYITGRHGNLPTIAPARSDNGATSLVYGLATSDFGTVGAQRYGYVTISGLVRGLPTNYTGNGYWGTTWQANDKLYVSKTDAGKLTNIEPNEPHHADIVGTVGVVGAVGQGSIDVNIIRHKTLDELSDVDGSAPDATGDMITWDNPSGTWSRNSYNIKDLASQTDLTTGLATKEPANANIQQHITNDADLVIGNEYQSLSKSKTGNNVTVNISNGTGTTFSVADGDSSLTNEIQDLSRTGDVLNLTGDATGVDLSDLKVRNDRDTVTQTSHGFVVTDWVRNTGGTFSKAIGTSAIEADVIGVVCQVIDANTFVYQYDGIFTVGSWLNGTNYYLSVSTAGAAATQSQTYEDGQVRVFLGTGITEGLLINIDLGDLIDTTSYLTAGDLSGTGYLKLSGTSKSYVPSIPNTDLANSSVTINGNAVSLGGSTTVTANTPNSLALKFDTGTTEGTDLYTFDGGSAKAIDIKAGTNVTLDKSAGSVTINASGGSSGASLLDLVGYQEGTIMPWGAGGSNLSSTGFLSGQSSAPGGLGNSGSAIPSYLSLNTGTSSNTYAYVGVGQSRYVTSYPGKIGISFAVNSTANIDIYAGFIDGFATYGSTYNLIGLKADNTDANYYFVSGPANNHLLTDTGVAKTTGRKVLIIDVVSSSRIDFFLYDTSFTLLASASHTTNIPATSTGMYVMNTIRNKTTTAKILYFYGIKWIM